MAKDLRAAKNFTNRLARMTPSENDDDVTDSGASLTYPVKATTLRVKGFVLLRRHPCKIVSLSTSKTGKHGHAKIHAVGIDVMSGKKYDDIFTSGHMVYVPVISQKEYIAVDINDAGYMTLIDDAGNTRQDLRAQDDDMRESIAQKLAKQQDTDVLVMQYF
ncbi:eukaryotic translation initiation factor 5A-1-like isoform X2 [Dreissena polymorpha]|uniref:eukaryotic translation initiation factor 5A-1-like isoform X2 n=1 Tax=Dreissena polymorpha TaxID=45954 RepID=UPI002263E094|nr:eukaryotic translation initiation factor 5A-1-like isoform X2 [Dreissena polymorpha]